MSDLLEAALAYARAGFPVFPVKLDKTPLTAHGFKDASRDEVTIRDWWLRKPGASIGMPTGTATGVVVLDEDPRHGGTESLAQLLAEHGALPVGPVTKTGGGGRHFWFSHPGGAVPSSVGFQPGLDLRADGGYVVVPPSPHASGNEYVWLVELIGRRLPLLPPWLLGTPSVGRLAPRRFEAGPGGKIPHGRHHDFIVQTAASLASRIAGLDEETLIRQVRGASREALDDAWAHEREIEEASRSALRKYGMPPPESPAASPPDDDPASEFAERLEG